MLTQLTKEGRRVKCWRTFWVSLLSVIFATVPANAQGITGIARTARIDQALNAAENSYRLQTPAAGTQDTSQNTKLWHDRSFLPSILSAFGLIRNFKL